jgi:hypothetical protein
MFPIGDVVGPLRFSRPWSFGGMADHAFSSAGGFPFFVLIVF